MSTYKALKISNSNTSNENLNINEVVESESIETSVLNNYQELNNKCDKVITKIKDRKLKSNRGT